MDKHTTSEIALDIAAQAHAGQVDKAGVPYMEHVTTVAAAVEPYGDEAVAVAFLHDVVEDTEWTQQDLIDAGIPENVASYVQALSRGSDLADENARAVMEQPDEKITYMDYIRGIVGYSARANAEQLIPVLVKYADNRHNALRQDATTPSLQARYHAAEGVLRSAIGDENADRIESAVKYLLAH